MLFRLIALWHRLSALFRRRRLDRDLQEELAFHLAMREADLAASGSERAEAHAAAHRRFGNQVRLKEELREMWTFPSIESVWQDVRYAVRTLQRAPAFTIVAVLTLALGIGGTTAIFSLGRAASVDSLPWPEPHRLVQLWGTVQRERVERRGASYPDYVDWRREASAFEDMAIVNGTTATLLLEEAERLEVEAVSAAYFSLLRVHPAIGRTFAEAEDRPGGGEPVVILSDGLWRRRFGADPGILGRAVNLDNRPFTVIGVMPPGFQGVVDRAQLWVPFTLTVSPETLARRGTRGFVALARLEPGVAIGAAQEELDAISRRLELAYPDTNEKRAVEVSPLDVELFGDLWPALRALTAAVALVLMMVCASVGNLLLARSETRGREIAVRTAIGASRTRLLRQLVTESCVLTGVGAAAGLAVAYAAIRALVAASPISLPSFAQPMLDGRAALFAAAIAVGSGVLLGFAPAVHARIARLPEALKDSARSTGSRRSARIRSILVVAEVSLAIVLLVGAGLMIRSVRNLSRLDPGFDPESVLTLRLSIPGGAASRQSAEAAAQPVDNQVLLDRIRSLPGVAAASLASDVPLEGSASASFYAAEGQGVMTAEKRPRAYVHRVTPDFFATLRIPILAGRTFDEREAVPDTPVVIVSEAVARRFWPGEDAIGKRLKLGVIDGDGPWRQIIGVVGEVKYRGLPDNPTSDPDIYFPMLSGSRQVAVVVRTSIRPEGVSVPLRAAVHAVNPHIPVYNERPLEDLVAAQSAPSRFTTWLIGVFAALSLLLATIGIYGVMSYIVAQRTREIGIRIALGASARQVVSRVLGSGARLVGVGILLGSLGAVVVSKVLAAQLFAVSVVDAAAIGAIALLAAVATLACAVPALRAARIDPLRALRQE